MATQAKRQRHHNKSTQKYRLLVIMTISIIAVGTIFWILNIEEVIKGSWSSVIAAVFTVLGDTACSSSVVYTVIP